MSALAFSAYAKLDISKDNDTRLTCKQVVSNSAAVRGIGVSRRLIQGGTHEAHQPEHNRDTRRSDDTCESNALRRGARSLCPRGCPGRADRKEGDYALRNALHFSAIDEH